MKSKSFKKLFLGVLVAVILAPFHAKADSSDQTRVRIDAAKAEAEKDVEQSQLEHEQTIVADNFGGFTILVIEN